MLVCMPFICVLRVVYTCPTPALHLPYTCPTPALHVPFMVPASCIRDCICVDNPEFKIENINGLVAVLQQVGSQWGHEVTSSQLHRCLAGINMPPLRAFSRVYEGAADLVLLPLEHYRRDGRVFRGVQRGAMSFLTKVSAGVCECWGASARQSHFNILPWTRRPACSPSLHPLC